MTAARWNFIRMAMILICAPCFFALMNLALDGRLHVTEFEWGGVTAAGLVRLMDALEAWAAIAKAEP